MSNQHKFKMIRQILAGAFVSVAGANAYAATVDPFLLPPINIMTAGQYGDFQVFSTELLQQCAAAGDPNCLPSGPYPVQAQPGQTDQALVIYMGDSWANNYDSSGPLTDGTPVGDNGFTIPQGAASTTYEMSSASEMNSDKTIGLDPAPGFAGDQSGTWEVQLGALASYLGWTDPNTPDGSLVFLFDNNQTGTSGDQWTWIWATASILNTTGTSLLCQSLYDNGASGCVDSTPVAPIFDTDGFITNWGATNYVGVVGDFCVYKDPLNPLYGQAYNIGTGSESTCGTDYYIKNDLGQNAEFAGWNQALEDFVRANYQANPNYVLSVNVKLAGLNNGGEQLYIPSNVFMSKVPEPGSLALLGIAFAAMWVPFRRRRQS